MPDLVFSVERAEPMRHAITAALALVLRVRNRQSDPVHSGVVACEVRIDAAARPYESTELRGLSDLFGEPLQHARTMGSLLWANLHFVLPSFTGETNVELALPLSFDLAAAAARYLYALEGGVVALSLLMSGTIFSAASDGGLRVSPLPWSRETSFALPVELVRETIDYYYPARRFIALERDLFDRLLAYKTEQGLPTLDAAIGALLPGGGS